MTRTYSRSRIDSAAIAAWEKYETEAEPDPYDAIEPERFLEIGDQPLLGELGGRWYIQNGRFQKTRRRSAKVVYKDDRRGHSSQARELARYRLSVDR